MQEEGCEGCRRRDGGMQEEGCEGSRRRGARDAGGGMEGCRRRGARDAGGGCSRAAAGALLGKSFLPHLPSKAVLSQTVVVKK